MNRLTVNESTQTGTRIQVLTSRADLSDAGSMLRTYVAFTPGASGTIKFRLSVLEDTSITAETFEYEPYEDIPFLALDNAQGQIESVAVEAGCRARQAGDGQRRNLLKNTQAFTGVNGESELTGETYNGFAVRAYDAPTTADLGELAQWSGAIYPKLNGIYTFSFWAKGTGTIDSYFYGTGTVAVSHVINSQGVESGKRDGNSKFTLSSTWTRYWVRWTLIGDGDITVPKSVLLRLFSGNNSASVCGAQLEEGSILTDWTPAPGDYAPVTGRESVEVRACGKNLLPIRTTDDTLTGISYHSNGDGSYTVNGTSTGNAAYILLQTVIPPGNYVLSGIDRNVSKWKCSGSNHTTAPRWPLSPYKHWRRSRFAGKQRDCISAVGGGQHRHSV